MILLDLETLGLIYKQDLSPLKLAATALILDMAHCLKLELAMMPDKKREA